jgi:formate-dependent nitrite reductase membrane component NrfD
LLGAAGTVASGALLIFDLGRPERFLNMLRVFRPTSPMNVGAWILSGAGGAAAGAVALRKTPIGPMMGIVAGVFGLGLATYTGVLVGNTAVPIWKASRRSLPLLFGASAVSAAGSAFDLIGSTRTTRIFANAGRVCEIAASVMLEQEASRVEYVARPLHSGFSSFLWRGAALLTAGSLVISLLPKQSRGTRVAAGLLGALGSLTTRFAVEHAGNKSARDPRATFKQQRNSLGIEAESVTHPGLSE